ncbi:DUF1801 domain-containing protein [Leptospira levettii]|uniref:DUF1801 domain-containing protein n=1 Tax=Leptospira levettii TaxID=2023178 RepID=UPI000C2ACE60|nr:DUF1801 domain-containing protein [Leptospira levettii]PKA27147.1 hypothetical protein CH381_06665 [Leptospira sp. mixed culture ATI2-C-A1]TGM29869.1 DUF1801 domain-containing protein [Leptospira levettii]TGM75758.1 DUF1801 domain-containing protein [Leptospira levettii]TGM84761.1 DUF1801 domain-containing protein [Leptospira levettii]
MPNTIDEYIESLPEGNKEAFLQLRSVVKKNLPKGFEETFQYKMIGYVVPKKLYPAGYHVNPELALPFLHIAVQKSGLALYHMGIYADPTLLKWFQTEYPKHCKTKLDMGKSCIRFKKLADIPWKLIGELVSKMTPNDWIRVYEKNTFSS